MLVTLVTGLGVIPLRSCSEKALFVCLFWSVETEVVTYEYCWVTTVINQSKLPILKTPTVRPCRWHGARTVGVFKKKKRKENKKKKESNRFLSFTNDTVDDCYAPPLLMRSVVKQGRGLVAYDYLSRGIW
jgi:hypothetical protein